jgi:hypothetical protein
MSRSRVVIILLVVSFLLVGGWKAFCFKIKLGMRTLLPVSTTEFHDYVSVGYAHRIYCAKAQMTFDGFQKYQEYYNYIPLSVEVGEQFSWNIHGFPAWWDPTVNNPSVYCTSDSVPKSFRVIKYENGYLYFLDWREYLW